MRKLNAMRRVALGLEYDGTEFAGFQRQAKGERTVQGVLEAALSELPGAVPKVVAAGRTDAGVHALEMVVHYDTEDPVPIERVPMALNTRLPPDLRVLWAKEVPKDFHARKSARWRAYRYRLLLRPEPSALLRHRALWVPEALDLAAMEAALSFFIGEHDFRAFATQETRSTRRTIYAARLRREGPELWIEVVGSGFLRGQVRAMVGSLLEVGRKKRPPEWIAELLTQGLRKDAGPTAPAHGLYFLKAGYRPWPSG